MRAAVFKGAGRGLAIEERPDPIPGPGEVVIKVGRAGICGSDLHMTSGHGQQLPTDSIIGHEFAGEVVAVGVGVRRIRLGDRIAPMPFVGCGRCLACQQGRPHRCLQARIDVVGGFGEFSRAGENDCVVLPAELSDEEGALIEPLAVGLQGVRKAAMAVGSRVLVTGAGAIGLATAFWANRLGAGRVAMLANSSRRAEIARSMGAAAFVSLQATEDVTATVNEVLGGPPDVVFEAVGLPGAIRQAIDLVSPLGTVVSLGFCGGEDSFVPAIALWKEVRLLFSMCYDKQDFQHAADVMAAGDHRPRAMITDTISLAALPAKFETLRGASKDCKVMVAPWSR
ncbi:MAG: alcohol dehydrogenase catalytic domain-containing protein [Rhodocyclales bacterium]|nr:alcohol dehydrogenase catalytic domain-containing protein [Rhodocyclales bacterium]